MQYVNDDNFLVYAARYYDNPSCSTESEFLEDVNKIKFILKMFRRYEKGNELNERLVLNHIILLYNVFHHDAATRMLTLKCRKYLHYLKPFLVLLNFWPERITNVGSIESVIIGSNIPMDSNLVNKLRNL